MGPRFLQLGLSFIEETSTCLDLSFYVRRLPFRLFICLLHALEEALTAHVVCQPISAELVHLLAERWTRKCKGFLLSPEE